MFEFALATAFLLRPALAGGNPCAGVDLAEDKFTHKQTASVRAHTGYAAESGTYSVVWWTAQFVDGKANLKLELPKAGVHSEVLSPGYKVMLLQKDGSVLELQSGAEVVPTPQSYNGAVISVWTVDFEVDKAVAAQLSSQPIVALRTPLPGATDLSWDMPKADGKDFTRAFTCYASLLP